jgi:hypothetical protein
MRITLIELIGRLSGKRKRTGSCTEMETFSRLWRFFACDAIASEDFLKVSKAVSFSYRPVSNLYYGILWHACN